MAYLPSILSSELQARSVGSLPSAVEIIFTGADRQNSSVARHYQVSLGDVTYDRTGLPKQKNTTALGANNRDNSGAEALTFRDCNVSGGGTMFSKN
jgi:hypothetical protein